MATDNRGVMIYLPSEIEIELNEYCLSNNITRTEKDGTTVPSLGKGILAYLKSQLLSNRPSNRQSKVVSDRLTKSEVLDLVNKSITNSQESTRLIEDRVLCLENKSVVLSERIESIEASQINNPPETINHLAAAINPPEAVKHDRKISRWSELLENEQFRKIVESAISKKWSNKKVVDDLFAAGFGQDKNTQPYSIRIVSNIKSALEIWSQ